MIYVGLTGWGDHDSIYPAGTKAGNKLEAYSSHFPTVEVDSSFYAIQSQSTFEKWIKQTPSRFSFIVKAYQGMTGHQRGEIPYVSKQEMYESFKDSLLPLIEADRLAMILCQFPPWFDCKKEHVDVLRFMREQLREYPLALEFRNRSWFNAQNYERTLAFMKKEGWIHTIVDEPQIGEGSVPTVLHPTHPNTTLIRLHGRNKEAWSKPASGEKWREIRYLYDYNETETQEWIKNVKELEAEGQNVYVIFNNNSGGHAAPNAKTFLKKANISYENLNPRQLNLFDGEDP
ncbi:DUF72 domain-containing protein [Salsuginibacillus kocurii]|uniref:DUF72 domain-containing protein n=1 Tax=Salsuginibacillus kocurii TaxID=427078 RepID=UPI00036FAF17|nr:DUF72 domain-containing protein [Salsuginibacillus kocurii]